MSSSALSPRLRARLAIGALLGALVYLGFALWADLGQVRAALSGFPLLLLPAAMGLSFLNYVVRFARWERYRRLLGIELARGTSFTIYLAGLALTVTPGKLGEAFKSVLLRRVTGTPIHRSAPIVVAERFTDLLGFLLLIAAGGIAGQPEYEWIFWATLLLCALLVLLAGSHSAARLVHAVVARLPGGRRLAPRLEGAFESARALLAPRELVLPVLIAAAGWSLECLGFWLVAGALVEGGLPLSFAVTTFSLSAVAGAVLIVFPGGLGVTEASMGGLLARRYAALGVAREAAQAKAAAATILIRLCTLWFAVALGLVAATVFSRLHERAGAADPGLEPEGGAPP